MADIIKPQPQVGCSVWLRRLHTARIWSFFRGSCLVVGWTSWLWQCMGDLQRSLCFCRLVGCHYGIEIWYPIGLIVIYLTSTGCVWRDHWLLATLRWRCGRNLDVGPPSVCCLGMGFQLSTASPHWCDQLLLAEMCISLQPLIKSNSRSLLPGWPLSGT